MNTTTSERIDNVFREHFSSLGAGVREEQKHVIASVLAGHNTLSLMPTGGGKSLCFWISGVALGGTTLAIFPLTALMDEQALKLRSHGFDVLVLHSGMNSEKQYQELIALAQGRLPDYILLSPERLATDGFVEHALRLQRDRLKLVVVDEIHCVSQWGHDFRPFYREIPHFLDQIFGNPTQWPVVLGMTATLSEKDIQQACIDFHIESERVLKSRYLLRYGIELEVEKVADEDEKDEKLWAFLEQHRSEKMLVYLDNRSSGPRSTEGMCSIARKAGFASSFFHAGLSSADKAEVIKQFKNGSIRLVFATSAFGMGIDIPDIRGVIHYRPPESVEQYYQQVGRVGRDGKPAWAKLYYSDRNVSIRKSHFIDRSFPSDIEIQKAFSTLTEGTGRVKTVAYFEDETLQSAFHYLLGAGVIRRLGKGIRNVNVFAQTRGVSLPKLATYQTATRTGNLITLSNKLEVPPISIVEDLYDWIAKGLVRLNGSPQKCLIIEQVADQLVNDILVSIARDVDEKKAYRYSLLEQLSTILQAYRDSSSLHDAIGMYLSIDRFEQVNAVAQDGRPTLRTEERVATESEQPQPLQLLLPTEQILKARIFTEGQTDWKHIKAALIRFQNMGLFRNLQLEFHEDESNVGDQELRNQCTAYSRMPQQLPILCVFDRDNISIVRQVTADGKDYKAWGNRVFSIVLPVPDHRRDENEVCIEFYYLDDDIKTKDPQGRRLYIGNEFNPRTSFHQTEDRLVCTERSKLGKFKIIDSSVFMAGSEENIALTKNDFAQNVLGGTPGFNDFDISSFVGLFELVEQLLSEEVTL